MQNLDKYAIIGLVSIALISLTATFLKAPNVMWGLVVVPFTIMAISMAIETGKQKETDGTND